MAETLAELLVRLGMDTSDLSAGINEGISGADKLESRFNGLVNAAKSWGAALATALPFAALGKAAFEASENIETAFNRIRAATGLTGDALEGMEGSLKRLYQQSPAALNSITDAMVLLSQRTGLTGSELEAMTLKFTRLAGIARTDVVPLIESMTASFKQFGVSAQQQGEAMNFLLSVFQKTGVPVQQLVNSLKQFAQPLSEMKFNFEQSAAMIGRFEQAGVSTEKVLGALSIAFRNFAKAGKEPAAALQELVAHIKNASTEVIANKLAVENFGKSALYMANAIRSGKLDIDAFVTSLKASGTTIEDVAKSTETWQKTWEKFQHTIEIALLPLGDAMKTMLEDVTKRLGPVADAVKAASAEFAKLPLPVQEAAVALTALAAAAPLVSKTFSFISAGFAPIIANAGVLSGAVGNIAYAVENGLVGALTIGEKALLGFGAALLIGVAVYNFKNQVEDLYKTLSEFSNLTGADKVFHQITEGIDSVAGSVSRFATETAGKMEEVLSKLIPESVVETLKRSAQTVEDALLGMIPEGLPEMIRKRAQEAEEAIGGLIDYIVSRTKNFNWEDIVKWGTNPVVLFNRFFQEGIAALRFWYGQYTSVVDGYMADLKKKQAQMMAPPPIAAPTAPAPSTYTPPSDAAKWDAEWAHMYESYTKYRGALLAAQVAMDDARLHSDMWLLNFPKYVDDTLAFSDAMNKLGASMFDVSKVQLPDWASQASGLTAMTAQVNALRTAFDSLGNVNATKLSENVTTATQNYNKIKDSGIATATEIKQAWINMEQAQISADAVKTGQIDQNRQDNLNKEKEALDKQLGLVKTHVKQQYTEWQQLGMVISEATSRAFEGLERGISQAIIMGQNLGDAFKKIAQDVSESILSGIIKIGLQPLQDELTKTIAKTFGLGDAFKKVFGTSTKTAADAAGNTAGKTAGNVGVAGGVTGLAGIVTAVGSAISAISSVISNFQLAKIETSLNAIEESTRYVKIAMLEGPNPVVAELERIRISTGNTWAATEWIKTAAIECSNYLKTLTSGGAVAALDGDATSGQLAAIYNQLVDLADIKKIAGDLKDLVSSRWTQCLSALSAIDMHLLTVGAAASGAISADVLKGYFSNPASKAWTPSGVSVPPVNPFENLGTPTSEQATNTRSTPVVIDARGSTFLNDRDIDRFGNLLVTRLRQAHAL